MPYIDILGYIAGILVTISLIPQTIKSWKTKSTKDLSLSRYTIYTSGLMLWSVYGFLKPNYPIGIMSVIGFFLALSILLLKIRYK
ncbi:SemiSWEET transporter [Candidatus Peregrinibacteria bacterium]|nr:SemiSWEET transporter [Candidatus Peregrinibacteria bacterium]